MEKEKRLDFNRVRSETHTAFYEIKTILSQLGEIDEQDHHCSFRETGKTVLLEKIQTPELKKFVKDAWVNLEKEVKRFAENQFYVENYISEKSNGNGTVAQSQKTKGTRKGADKGSLQ